jgi:hypothetical protein
MTLRSETDLERSFTRVLWLLREYLPDLVIIGGWVPYLYRRYSGDPWVGGQSRTGEVDVLTMPPLPVRQGVSLDAMLRAAGLVPRQDTGPSAVWSAASDTGEEIEFLTPLHGAATELGSTVGVHGHGRLGAIRLVGLEILGRHTNTMTVPVGDVGGRMQDVAARVPRLGAYVVNKGATFLARRAHASGSNPKQAKDLVYVHDVMAASDVVRKRVETDIQGLWQQSKKASIERQAIRTASNNLSLALGGTLGVVTLAAEELGTRDGLSSIDAAARIRGQLTDLLEILRETQRSRALR